MRVLSYWIGKDRGWIRLFGFGISWKHKSNELLFSEMYGYTNYVTIFNYRIKLLNNK